MTPAGIAAAQARISAIESRFAPPPPAEQVSAGDVARFEHLLATARAEGAGTAPASALQLPATQSPWSSSGPAPTTSTAMGPAGPPAELVAHGNGRIPAEALAPIGQGSHRMWAPAAAAFSQMAAAAAQDGVAIRVTDSYRSYEAQVEVAERKGLYSEGGLAARPGTSNHGWGRALDLDTDDGAVEWLRANAARFGFHEDVPREPWHWTYRPG